MEQKIVDQIFDIITSNTDLTVNDSIIYVPIYADYSDSISNIDIAELSEAENPRQYFEDKIADLYFDDTYWTVRDKLLETIQTHWDASEISIFECVEEIEDWLDEHICLEYPIDHFLKQRVCVDIIVDTGDENYDYVSNSFYPHYGARESDTIPNEASLLWLAKQQGYKKSQLNDAARNRIYHNSKLLESIRGEVLNASTHMNALVFFVEMTLDELISLWEAIKDNSKNDPPLEDGSYRIVDMRKGRKFVVIDKSVNCGLVDFWSGAGSVLEIDLEKDVRLPLRYISSALPDEVHGYSVKSIYGMDDSYWTEAVKSIK